MANAGDTTDKSTTAGAAIGPSDHAAELLQIVYDELRALASAYLRNERGGHTLQTTALVHEAWLRLHARDGRLFDNRAHFFRAAALAMRRVLLHHAERRRAAKRGGGRDDAQVEETLAVSDAASERGFDLLALDEALKRLALEDEQKAKVVELRFFGGCSIAESAEALGISTATVEREWRFARAWLWAELSPESAPGAADDGEPV
jgi:RNA polymerase sigma factor (TIGR02999 family)